MKPALLLIILATVLAFTVPCCDPPPAPRAEGESGCTTGLGNH